jgi:putative ABC transport system permease protein
VEKGRFAISVLGVAFAVLLILIVVALYRGWSRTGAVFEQLPGQLWVVQQGTSDPFHSASLLTPEQLQRTADVPGVETVVPVLQRQMTFTVNGGEEQARLMALKIPLSFPLEPELRRQFLPSAGQVVIDTTFSRQSGLDKGDSVQINGVDLTVADVRSPGGDVFSEFAFVSFADAERIFGVGDVVTYGMVVLAPGSDTAAAKAAIEQSTGQKVYTAEEFAHAVRKMIDQTFIPIILILVAIGFVVGAAVVGLTIYTATIERSRDFGVMKAVGASPGFLYRIVLSQAAMLTGAGFVVGLIASLVTADIAARAVPKFATDFQIADLAAVLAASVIMGVVASFLPVRRIVRIDPAMVFRA